MSGTREAIALTYDGANAPTLSARGQDAMADTLLALARSHDVPIYEDADLVRLLSALEPGEAIPESLYLCIAEILAFAWYLQGRSPPARQEPSANHTRLLEDKREI